MNPSSPPQPTTNSISGLFRRHPKLVLKAFAACILLSIVIDFVKPATWRSVTILQMSFSTQDQSSPLSLLNAMSSEPIRILSAFLETKRAKTFVSDRIHNKIYWDKIDYVVRPDAPSGEISVTFIDKDPKIARDVLLGAIEALHTIEDKIGFTTGDLDARKMEVELRKREDQLKQAEDAVLQLAQRVKTAPDPTQLSSAFIYRMELTKATQELAKVEVLINDLRRSGQRLLVGSETLPVEVRNDITEWRSTYEKLAFDLSTLRISKGESNPEVVHKREEVEIARKRLQTQISQALKAVKSDLSVEAAALIAQRLTWQSQVDYLRPLAKVGPAEMVEMTRLATRLQIAQQTVKDVTAAYQLARIHADASPTRWTVLVDPYIEDKPANKGLLKASLYGIVVGFVVAWILTLRKEKRMSSVTLTV